MPVKLFITGTDTEVGKTYVSVNLLNKFKDEGYTVVGLKPVASGALWEDGQLVNDDAKQLNQASSIKLLYNQTNPAVFEEPIAPHIAASKLGKSIKLDYLTEAIESVFEQHPADIYLIEGAGGWSVPINDKETLADLAKQLSVGVILVIGIKLGCINHAILTANAIRQSNLELIGWIANYIDPLVAEADNIICTLKNWLPEPCLAVIPYCE